MRWLIHEKELNRKKRGDSVLGKGDKNPSTQKFNTAKNSPDTKQKKKNTLKALKELIRQKSM